MNTYIYALIDPTTHQLRYIGKTNDIKQRFNNHLNSCRDKNTHKRNWINKLKRQGLKPEIEVIDVVLKDNWKFWEIFWVAYYKSLGCDLLNYTLGGDGLTFGNKTSFKKGHGFIPIYQIDLEGNIIKEFESITTAENILKYKIAVVDKIGRTTANFIFYKKETWDNLKLQEKNNILSLATKEKRYFRPNSIKTRFKKGQQNYDVSKKVKQIDKHTGIMINTFNSVKEAKIKTGAAKISDVLHGHLKTSGGYKWELLTNE